MIAKGHVTTADGCRLAYEVEGEGRPVLWQHGLGAPMAQPAEVFPHDAGLQRITLACRGHEGSVLGDPGRLSIAQFADDALALVDHLGLDRVEVGGISLGAAIALRLGALHPGRVTRMVLARPAWIDRPGPDTQMAYPEVARLLADHGREEGRARLVASRAYRDLLAVSPDKAASMLAYFDRPDAESTVALLSRIPLDGPGITREQMREVRMPTLVVVSAQDHVHPASYGEALAALIPEARLAAVTPKGESRAAYVEDFRRALAGFLMGVPA